jgi:hypothetical protein
VKSRAPNGLGMHPAALIESLPPERHPGRPRRRPPAGWPSKAGRRPCVGDEQAHRSAWYTGDKSCVPGLPGHRPLSGHGPLVLQGSLRGCDHGLRPRAAASDAGPLPSYVHLHDPNTTATLQHSPVASRLPRGALVPRGGGRADWWARNGRTIPSVRSLIGSLAQ